MSAVLDHAPLIGLLFFFVLFVAIAVWTYLPRNKNRLRSHGSIPLKDENDGRQ
jgi:cbb3-type cytochrome oxidase subunit 3